KFGEILNKRLSPSFFPTRFGGEEFVITLSGKNGNEAKDIIDSLRKEFETIIFSTPDEKKFSISFSAGISEYPLFGKNLSILLSRADQALYAAKKEGKSRTYIFDPIMAKNDRFWEYLKKSSHFFTDKKNRDAVTNLPFLHSSLESISNLNFEIKSIGIITVKIDNISSLRLILGTPVTDFILENLKITIKKTCENIFSTDTFISVSDIKEYNFIIKFPSIIDFSVNKEKCRTLYRKICRKIEKAFSHLPVHLKFADSIIFFNKKNPRTIISEIDNLLQKSSFLNRKISKKEEPENIINYPDLLEKKFFQDNFEIKYISGPELNKYAYISLKNLYSSFSSSCRFLNSAVSSKTTTEYFLRSVSYFIENVDCSVILPKIHHIDFSVYISLIKEILPDRKVFISINETDICEGNFDIPKELFPPKSLISLAVSDCYISAEILNLISHFDFRLIILSEHLTMCLHCFKDRIKILNGFKIFADQLEIDICSSNVANTEDIQLLKDINIIYSDRNEL
ncbi:MAG: GGDEF domain-containing protein, partial [Spirochaetes bacterium]|nr:GGDEF domain-containing protein [Spirochaetota bacterium]